MLVRAFQVRGHHIADLDPLHMGHGSLTNTIPPELTIEQYGWSESDYDKEYELGPGILPRCKDHGTEKMSLRKIIDALKIIYC